MPDGSKAWTSFFKDKQLPAIPTVGKQALQLLKSGDYTYKDLAYLINRDPVLSFHILSAANETKSAEQPLSKSVDHAISMIGLDALRTVIAKVPYFKPDATNIRHFYYLRALSTSLMAGYLAKAISQYRPTFNTDTLFWTTLFCGAPTWYLWRFATPEMRLVRYAVRSNGKGQEQAETEILGCTVRDIGIEFCKHLPLPELTQQCFKLENTPSARALVNIARASRQKETPAVPEDRALNHLMGSPTFVPLLCNLLAQQATHDWYSRATLRYLKILSVYLHLSLDRTISIVHQAAATVSQAHPIPGVMAPAAKLMLPPREYINVNSFADVTVASLIAKAQNAESIQQNRKALQKELPQKELIREEPQKEPQAVPDATVGNTVKQPPIETLDAQNTPPSKTPQADKSTDVVISNPETQDQGNIEQGVEIETGRKANYTLFKQLIHSLSKQPEEFADLHEIMNAAVQGISYGLGLARTTVALVNTKHTRLKAYYTAGTRKNKELGTFQIDLTKPNLFHRLIQSPASIWIKPDTNRSTWALIPPEFKKTAGVQEFFLMSVFVGDKPVAVFYAD
ncbi:MAG: HDOD domain-containing protein, partial [Pseudomonadales bacterium]|nr:HDOD domain-containing protein [Pseudomonadales bacterium]